MSVYNNGEISVPVSDIEKTIEIMNNSAFARECMRRPVKTSDFIVRHGMADLDIIEVYGDIEDVLKALVEALASENINADVSVSYYGDYEGAYQMQDGNLINKTQEEITLETVSDNMLYAEVARRMKCSSDKSGIFVDTPLGRLHAYPSSDSDYPGIWIDITDTNGNGGTVALVEVSKTEYDDDDKPYNSPQLITRAWRDCSFDDFTDKVVHDMSNMDRE